MIFAASGLFAQSIPNWPAPATWSPTRSHGGLGTQDLTNPLPFIALAPCRIVDTRGGAPITGGLFTGGSDVRNYAVAGICGIPGSARALSLNFTVTSPGQTAAGFLLAWPTGGAVPPVSVLNWDHVPAQIANAAVVPTSAGVSITVNVSAPTHVIMDVNGYYYDGNSLGVLAPEEGFVIIANQTGGSAIYGENRSTADFSRGIRGIATGTTGATRGVLGQTSSSSDGAAGVLGQATATTGFTSGVLGISDSILGNSAGVRGLDFSGAPIPSANYEQAGVRGESALSVGVLGNSRAIGVLGSLVNTGGVVVAQGILGSIYGTAADATGPPWGVFAVGNLGASGTKHFVEPHPSDPKKVILYSSLEGREVGTYFRGTARVVNHQAVIDIPEDFRIVTDDEGLTVQLTPVGDLATLAVINQDLNHIVVKASRDVTFHYFVQGVRRAFKDVEPVRIGYEFMPRSPEETIPLYLSEEARRRLIANGTYNPDGTVNMETAERAGWTKIWADRQAAAEATARKAAQQTAQTAGFNKP